MRASRIAREPELAQAADLRAHDRGRGADGSNCSPPRGTGVGREETGLTGFLSPETTFEPRGYGYFDDTTPRETYIAKVNALEAFVPQYASSLAARALKFALWHPGVTTAITSMHEQHDARMNLAATAEPRLPREIFERLMFKHRFIKSFMDVRNFADLDATPDQPIAYYP